MMDQVTERKARKILRSAGKILKETGKPYTDKKAVLKETLKLAGKAFIRGGLTGAAGLDPQMAETEDLYGFKTVTRDGVTETVKEVPTLDKNREQASYYFNLGSALIDYSKARWGTDGMPLVREAFRQIAEENACEYKTLLELASQLSILRKSSVEYCRNVPDRLAGIDLGIRRALAGNTESPASPL